MRLQPIGVIVAVLCGVLFSGIAGAVDVVDFSKESPQLQLQKMRQQNAEMQLQINKFHKEFLSLRGEIEQLQYQVREIEKARENEAQQRQLAATQAQANQSQTVVGLVASTPTTTTADGLDQEKLNAVIAQGDIGAYQSAFNELKSKRYDKAQLGLSNYLQAYPQGEYAANAHYWLGEVYLLKNESKPALDSFKAVVEQFPDDSKAYDARYKLAQIYNRSGADDKAQELLINIIEAENASARIKELAQAFKRKNYPN